MRRLLLIILLLTQVVGCKYFKRTKLTPELLPSETANQTTNPNGSQSLPPPDTNGGGGYVCGNGNCETGESNATCPADCPPPPPPPDTTPPTVTSVTPAENATAVSRDTIMTGRFSEPIDTTTLTATSFTVTQGSALVAGTITTTESGATFTPTSRLAPSTIYTVTLTTAVKDPAGNPMAANRTWNFTTQGLVWSTPTDIDNNLTGYAVTVTPHLAFDSQGNGFAVWATLVATNPLDPTTITTAVYARRYDQASRSWGTTTTLGTGAAEPFAGPQVGFDGMRNGFAAWIQKDGAVENVYVRRYNATAAMPDWGGPSLIDALDSNAGFHRLAVTPAGDAFVIWRQPPAGAGSANIYFNRFDYDPTTGGGWGSGGGTPVDDLTGIPGYAPMVAADVNGNAFACWSQRPTTVAGSKYNVYCRRYTTVTDTLGPVEEIDGQAESAGDPWVALASTGQALVVWSQPAVAGGSSRLYRRSYDPTTSWGPPLPGAPSPVSDPVATGSIAGLSQVAWQPGGSNATIIWAQYDGTTKNIYARSANTTTGLGPITLLDSGSGEARSPSVAMDSSGDAYAVWEQKDHQCDTPAVDCWSLFANHYNGVGWEGAVLLEHEETGNTSMPRVTIDPATNTAIAIWNQTSNLTADDTTTQSSIFVSRFE